MWCWPIRWDLRLELECVQRAMHCRTWQLLSSKQHHGDRRRVRNRVLLRWGFEWQCGLPDRRVWRRHGSSHSLVLWHLPRGPLWKRAGLDIKRVQWCL
jgi:hypothetical protein